MSRKEEKGNKKNKNLDEVARDVAAGDVEPARQMRHGESFVDGANVGDTVARVDDDARQQALGVQRQHGLDGHVGAGEAVFLEHDLPRVSNQSMTVTMAEEKKKTQNETKKGLRWSPTSIIFSRFLTGFMGGSVSSTLHWRGSMFIFSEPKV